MKEKKKYTTDEFIKIVNRALDEISAEQGQRAVAIGVWLARDEGGALVYCSPKPEREAKIVWMNGGTTRTSTGVWVSKGPQGDRFQLPGELFENITWESEPVPAKIIIRRADK